MKRPQYVFRPNLSDPQHRRASVLLQQVPSAKRKEFLVQSTRTQATYDFLKITHDGTKGEVTVTLPLGKGEVCGPQEPSGSCGIFLGDASFAPNTLHCKNFHSKIVS